MHRILERQIKQSLGDKAAISPQLKVFFGLVSDTYTHFDEDQALISRSLDLSSEEYLENNRRLEKNRIKIEKQARNLASQVANRTKILNERVAELEDVRKAMTNLLEDFEEKQQALAAAKAKDEAMLASIGDGIIATDRKGRVIQMNRAAEKLLGWKNVDCIGKKLSETLSVYNDQGGLVPFAKQSIQIALATGKTNTAAINYFYKRKNGTKLPVAITAAPILIDDNIIIGAIEVFRDITKEKEIEKLRMDFLSLASHQLRTPLSGTKWLIETMQKEIIGKLNSKQKEYIDNIYQVNERMIKLVSDMLNVLTLESGVAVIKKQKVSTIELCKELFLIMHPATQNKGIILRNVLVNQPLLWLETDPQILRNILECFVSNAINYSKNGQKVVLNVKEKSNVVVFSVKDSGIGIPKEEQGKISERFYRASNAKIFKPDGTGLGLYIAYMLAEQIGAKISFESKENRGTIFHLQVFKSVDDKNINKKSKASTKH